LVENSLANAPPQRLVVLGASNVAKGLEVLLHLAPRMIAPQLEIFTAIGRGRSYGLNSQFCFRVLPSIIDCQLWQALEDAPNHPSSAIITDVGNDLVYGQTPCQIETWVDEAIQRLKKHTSSIVLSGVPTFKVKDITRLEFYAIRSFLFPHSTLQFDSVATTVDELQQRLESLAMRHSIQFVHQDPTWYGRDPVHWKQWARPVVLQRLLYELGHSPTNNSQVPSRLVDSMRHWFSRPHERKLFGITQRIQQPSVRRGNAVTLSMY